jgi:D-glycero-D-manno-heptose 1,7-bisphosphate phosphatase
MVEPGGPGMPAAVLFDRDGTLIADLPGNADPAAVRPVGGARRALDRLRELGVPVGVVSNQPSIAAGLITVDELDRANARMAEQLGPFAVVCVCPHGPDDGCGCRKPAAGLIDQAAERLGVPVDGCVVVGDIGADVEAASAAGARGILVPNARTRSEEVRAARWVAPDLEAAVELALSFRRDPPG